MPTMRPNQLANLPHYEHLERETDRDFIDRIPDAPQIDIRNTVIAIPRSVEIDDPLDMTPHACDECGHAVRLPDWFDTDRSGYCGGCDSLTTKTPVAEIR